jgi:hypothetical protein
MIEGPLYEPVDIGTSGRRACAFFTRECLVVEATDADAAGHAMAVVIEALRKAEYSVDDSPFVPWSLDILAALPAFPDEECTLRTEVRGDDVALTLRQTLGRGYVRPVPPRGHECGGALYHPGRMTVTPILAHTVWLAGGGTHKGARSSRLG